MFDWVGKVGDRWENISNGTLRSIPFYGFLFGGFYVTYEARKIRLEMERIPDIEFIGVKNVPSRSFLHYVDIIISN